VPARSNRGWQNADVGRAEAAARRAFDDLGLKTPTEASIEAIAYEMGALVRDIPMTGAVGRLSSLGSRAIISISTSVTFEGRRRWTVAHELGHFLLHRDHNQIQLLQEASVEEHYDQGIEREANAFASEFLMPERLWTKHVDVKRPDLDIVRGLAKQYQVSLMGAAIRFVKLCPERCAVVFAKGRRVQWFAAGPEFHHWIQPKQELDSYTLAYDYFAKGQEPRRRESVSASAWFSDDRIGDGDDDAEVFEDCLVIPSLDATLSLLWIPIGSDH
jgi:uncharacterized protein DUF955